MTLDQAKNEIHGKLQNDRMREKMEKLNNSFKVETNEAYFGPGGANPMPRRGDAARVRECLRRSSAASAAAGTATGRKTAIMAKPVVVVTGVSGNLGSRLLPLLGSYSVIGVDVNPPQTDCRAAV